MHTVVLGLEDCGFLREREVLRSFVLGVLRDCCSLCFLRKSWFLSKSFFLGFVVGLFIDGGSRDARRHR